MEPGTPTDAPPDDQHAPPGVRVSSGHVSDRLPHPDGTTSIDTRAVAAADGVCLRAAASPTVTLWRRWEARG